MDGVSLRVIRVLDGLVPLAQVVKTTPASGIVDITLLEADTTSLTPGSYYIELEGVDGSGNSEVFAVGTLTLEPNIDNA